MRLVSPSSLATGSRFSGRKAGPAQVRFALDPMPLADECRAMVEPEDVVSAEWAEWYRMSPQERWSESQSLWQQFLYLGGSLDPEPDTQSPFYDPDLSDPPPSDGRPGLRVVRRSGV